MPLTCASRPAAGASLAPATGPLYPTLTRRLLAGALDLLVCGWFFVLAVALVHLATPGTRLHLEDAVMRALALTGVMFLLYYFATESSHRQASVGKRLMGLKVMDRHGAAPGFERSASRFVLTLAGLASGGLLFLTALRSRRGQCLQDRLTGTMVVMRDALPGQLRVHERVADPHDARWSVLCCAGLLGLAQAVGPWWQDLQVAWRVDRALLAARPLAQAVSRQVALTGRVPDTLQALGEPLRLEDGDAVVERLHTDGSVDLRLRFAPVQGATLRLKARAGATPGEAMVHRCVALDLAPAHTPGRCDRAPGA